jgi:hypothetical protein
MCAVSATMEYMQRIPIDKWDRPAFNDFQEVIRRLEALDAKLDQPDCHDPAKAEWMRAVEERLEKLETATT